MYQTAGGAPSPENTHELVVQALDRGQPLMSSDVAVTITILPADQNSVYFHQAEYSTAVAENVATGTSVIQVAAGIIGHDDVGMMYSEAGGNGTSFFNLNQNTGAQRSPFYHYFLIITESSSLTLTAKIFLSLF